MYREAKQVSLLPGFVQSVYSGSGERYRSHTIASPYVFLFRTFICYH
jgi:hypothetical protein